GPQNGLRTNGILLVALVGGLWGLVYPLAAGTSDYVLSIIRRPLLRPPPTIITFDAPGAGTGGPFQGTLVAGINPAGVISGGFYDANYVEHTYLRFPDGTFTTFDAAGAGTGPFQGTGPYGINPAGGDSGAWSGA